MIEETNKRFYGKSVKKQIKFSCDLLKRSEEVEEFKKYIDSLIEDGWVYKSIYTDERGIVEAGYNLREYSGVNLYNEKYKSCWSHIDLVKKLNESEINRLTKETSDKKFDAIISERQYRSKRREFRAKIEERLKLIDAYENTDCKFEVFNKSTSEWNNVKSPSFDDLKKQYRIVKN